MNGIQSVAAFALAALLALAGAARGGRAAGAEPAAVVGTFDSRAVALAWVRSPQFAEYLEGQRADLEHALARARAAGDRETAAQLAAIGPALQERLHRQGFGTAPVDDILARLEERLPVLAREAGVDVIVSKWTLAYRRPGVELVDVTDRLVAEFQPDEATLGLVRELSTRAPLAPDAAHREH